MLKLLKGLYIITNIAIIVALLVLHFFIKDSTFRYSLWFYSFPLPLIILIVFFLSVFLGKYRVYNLVVAGILLVIWLGRSLRISFPDPKGQSDLEIVFWNASRDHDFKKAIEINGGVPDVLVLTETNDIDFVQFKERYPSFYTYKGRKELRIFSRTPLTIVQDTTTHFSTSLINFKTAGINFYAVDVSGSLDVPRSWELGFLEDNIPAQDSTIILGDFNVPYESLLLGDIKKSYMHFFASKGNGFRETWFYGLPFLSLDQIWLSPNIKIKHSIKRSAFSSDHSLVGVIISKN